MMIENELTHWGILGMKWGIRRYQNPDGSLTEAGKKRYAKMEKKRGSDDYERVKELKKKKTKDLTNEELEAIVTRKRLEDELKSKKMDPETKRMILSACGTTLKTAVKIGAVAAGAYYLKKHLPGITASIAKNTAKKAASSTVDTTKKAGRNGLNVLRKAGQATAGAVSNIRSIKSAYNESQEMPEAKSTKKTNKKR